MRSTNIWSKLDEFIQTLSGARRDRRRTADRAVVSAGELVVPRQEEVDLLLADEDLDGPQTEERR